MKTDPRLDWLNLASSRALKPYHDWALFVGGWGDVLIGLGHLQAMLLCSGRDALGAVYFGPLHGVDEFLSIQDGVREVRWAGPTTGDQYHNATTPLVDNWQGTYPPGAPSRLLLAGTGVEPRTCVNTYVLAWPQRLYGNPIPANVNLPPNSLTWARRVLPPSFRTTVLLQPYSLFHVSQNEHWRDWIPGLHRLVGSHQEIRFVLAGKRTENWQVDTRYQALDDLRAINLVDQTPTVQEVWAMAQRADLVITTLNGLSKFCTIEDLRAITMSCRGIRSPDPFYDWANRRRNLVLGLDTSVEEFLKWVEVKLEAVASGEDPPHPSPSPAARRRGGVPPVPTWGWRRR